MDIWLVVKIIALVVLILGVGLIIFKLTFRSLQKREHQREPHKYAEDKHNMSVYVIEKKKGRVTRKALFGAQSSQLPLLGWIFRRPLVNVQIETNVVTFVCNRDVYGVLPEKKTVTVEMKGIYITGLKIFSMGEKDRKRWMLAVMKRGFTQELEAKRDVVK